MITSSVVSSGYSQAKYAVYTTPPPIPKKTESIAAVTAKRICKSINSIDEDNCFGFHDRLLSLQFSTVPILQNSDHPEYLKLSHPNHPCLLAHQSSHTSGRSVHSRRLFLKIAFEFLPLLLLAIV